MVTQFDKPLKICVQSMILVTKRSVFVVGWTNAWHFRFEGALLQSESDLLSGSTFDAVWIRMKYHQKLLFAVN